MDTDGTKKARAKIRAAFLAEAMRAHTSTCIPPPADVWNLTDIIRERALLLAKKYGGGPLRDSQHLVLQAITMLYFFVL